MNFSRKLEIASRKCYNSLHKVRDVLRFRSRLALRGRGHWPIVDFYARLRNKIPQVPLLLFSLALLLLCVSIVLALLVNKSVRIQEPAEQTEAQLVLVPTSSEPDQPARLVTAEQIARLSYEDSVLGPLTWDLSEEGLEELNQTLLRYNIVTGDEICHFLAQATVETGAGQFLTEAGDEAYFRKRGYSTGTRGAGYLHLTHDYGQMAFATWMMKRYIPALEQIQYVSPANSGTEDITAAYYAALQSAANLGVNVSRYSRIVYDPNSPVTTGADYIAENFAWESAGYYWVAAGIGKALAAGDTDAVSHLVGGSNWQSRREAYTAFYPVLSGTS